MASACAAAGLIAIVPADGQEALSVEVSGERFTAGERESTDDLARRVDCGFLGRLVAEDRRLSSCR